MHPAVKTSRPHEFSMNYLYCEFTKIASNLSILFFIMSFNVLVLIKEDLN